MLKSKVYFSTYLFWIIFIDDITKYAWYFFEVSKQNLVEFFNSFSVLYVRVNNKRPFVKYPETLEIFEINFQLPNHVTIKPINT